mmetsp:Transcript_37671/g.100229  ORF Transcript_37671/g.100229 Transcript_37671/m.100229 type:complete len:90 (+) Transcript_37671:685-954(+)
MKKQRRVLLVLRRELCASPCVQILIAEQMAPLPCYRALTIGSLRRVPENLHVMLIKTGKRPVLIDSMARSSSDNQKGSQVGSKSYVVSH